MHVFTKHICNAVLCFLALPRKKLCNKVITVIISSSSFNYNDHDNNINQLHRLHCYKGKCSRNSASQHNCMHSIDKELRHRLIWLVIEIFKSSS